MAANANIGLAKEARGTSLGGASRSILLRAVVRPFCKLSKVHRGMRLRGATDDGAAIDSTIGSEGGFTIICNKPYAMNLERAPVWGAPERRPTRRRAAAEDPFAPERALLPVFGTPGPLLERRRVAAADARDAFALARVAPAPRIAQRDFEVVLSVDLNDGPLLSSCVMGSTEDAKFVCHAFPGANSARLPLPRMDARMVVKGADAAAMVASNSSAAETLLALPASDGGVPDTVLRKQRTGDRLTISVTAKY